MLKANPVEQLVIAKPNGENIIMDYLILKRAALTLRAINHKLRREMIKLIDEHKKMTVTELYVQMRIEQSVASQHLALMRKAGFLNTDREGKFIYYSVNRKKFEEISRLISEIAQPE